MGANLSNLRAGDDVVIGIKDLDVIQQMQQNHGGWHTGMNECLIGPCKIVQGIGTDAVVKTPSGNVYRLNAELLVKYNAAEVYKTGTIVEIIKDEELFKEFQSGRGGWTENMKDILGKKVEIIQKSNDGDYKVKYNNKCYTINSKSIVNGNDNTPKLIEKKLKEGDKVFLIKNVEEMKKLQQGHGGWSELISLLCGQEVEVVKLFDDGDCYVSRFGMEWLINPKCIEDENKQVEKKSRVFKKGDIVQISSDVEKSKKLQQFHGGWITAMKLFAGKNGKVESILPTGDVKVNVNGMGFVYNPELLRKIDEKDTSKMFSPGDKVRVIKDKDKVKRLQKGHGEWVDTMKLLLGEKGKVKSLFADGDLRVKILGQKVTLNPECVERTDSDSESEPDIMKLMQHMTTMMTGTSDKSDDSEKDSDREMPEQLNDQTLKFFLALRSGDLTQVRNLVDLVGANTHKKNVYPLMIAASEGHEDIAKLLIDKQAELNAKDSDGDTALHIAVQKNRFDICRLLVNVGANVNAQNDLKVTPIMVSAISGSQDILRLLVNCSNADLSIGDSDNDTPLHLAIQKSRIDSVETLLNAGADIKALNNKQFNAYHLAALRGHERILEMFLKKEGASIVDLQKEDKFAAIHLVALNNHPGCLRILINYNADVNIRNNKLQTALHVAVSQKYLECVKILVENKAELNLKDESGDTPLHDGIRIQNMERVKKMSSLFGMGDMFDLMQGLQKGSDNPEDIIMYLVENGAKLDIKNNSGKTPLSSCEDDVLKAKLLRTQDGKVRKISETDSYKPPPVPIPVASVVPTEVPVVRSRDEEIEELRRTIQAMEDEKICVICRDRRINVTFGCGHMSCDVCANNLYECHMCRRNIDNKIRIYE